MTKKIWIVSLLLISCGIITVLFIRVWDGHVDIAAGNIAYTYNCAWVDWKHARPGDIKVFVDDFSKKFAQTPLNETFKITYKQRGGLGRKGYNLSTYSISKEYEILKFSENEIFKKKLMFQIFKEVSYLFENEQKKVFGGILKSSAFREGDLMGNLIGFYIACDEMTQEEAAELCEKLPVSISLQLKKEGKFAVTDTFRPDYKIVINDNAPAFPTQLMKYNYLENFEKYITPLRKSKNTTFFK